MVLLTIFRTAYRGAFGILMTGYFSLAVAQSIATGPKTLDNIGQVLTVSQQISRLESNQKVCWQSIITDRQKAKNERDKLPWIDKNWIPLTAGVVTGLLAGYAMHRYTTAAWYFVMPTMMASAAAGFFITKMLMPTPTLLKPTVAGEYLTEQKFYLEQACSPGIATYKETAYQVNYLFKGEKLTATLAYDPGERVKLNEDGRPINEIKKK